MSDQHKYEIMVIIDPAVEDRAVAPTLEKFLAAVTNEGGTVDNIDIWGRRKFAYEIAKKSEGIYVVINVTSTAAAVNEVDRLLKISEAVLRTKVLRAEEAVVVLDQAKAS